MKWDPSKTPNFSVKEMKCKCNRCGGKVDMDHDFMLKLQKMRDVLGPLSISSGYRCPDHPNERIKENPGAHSQGLAADIVIRNGHEMYKVGNAAHGVGMVGIGFSDSFVHVDGGNIHAKRPASWTY